MRQIERYELLEVIGEGRFGSVRRARDRQTNKIVAVKFISIVNCVDGLPHPVARQLLISQRLHCPYIVKTFDIFACGSAMVLVMQFCTSDLLKLLQSSQYSVISPLPLRAARLLFHMLLSALQYLHSRHIIHRDVKPSNCFLDSHGSLKLGDFGLSRAIRMREYRTERSRSNGADITNSNNNDNISANKDYSEENEDGMTHEVVSRWYRAPELLLGCRQYDDVVDMWSAGCVLWQLIKGTHAPMFAGNGDINQLSLIYSILGTPSAQLCPTLIKCPDYDKIIFEPKKQVDLSELLPTAPASSIDLLRKLLCLQPTQRIRATEALRHPFFMMDDL